ncbi:hypothetical protein P3T35_007087 [Kitasatospora sp. GP30]|nr:hypothetical protein [Kitasatospora sp. GP30]
MSRQAPLARGFALEDATLGTITAGCGVAGGLAAGYSFGAAAP